MRQLRLLNGFCLVLAVAAGVGGRSRTKAPSSIQSVRFVIGRELAVDQAEMPLVGKVYPNGRGLVAVAERDRHGVAVFDSLGELVVRVGRRGAGPGEFTTVSNVGWVGPDLWVSDQAVGRITVLGRIGRNLTASVRTVAMAPGSRPTQLGGMLADSSALVVPDPWTGPPIAGLTMAPILAQTKRHGLAQIASVWYHHPIWVIPLTNGTMRGAQPWSDDDLWDLSPVGDRVIILDRGVRHVQTSSACMLRQYSHTGASTFTARVTPSSLRLGSTEVRRWLDSTSETLRSDLAGAPLDYLKDELGRAVFVPRLHPCAIGLLPTPDGGVWLWRSSRTWDGFDSTGRLSARGVVQDGVRLIGVDGKRAWVTVRHGSDGAVSLNVATIEATGSR